jgi:hypothetical protein
MKLITFDIAGEQHIGALVDDLQTVVDLTASDAGPHFRTMLDLIDGGEAALDRVAGQPSDPAKVEIAEVWYRQPIYYKCNRFTVVGTDHDVTWPRYSKVMDYELEFGCVIGTGGKNISREKAREHIFGYCIFNDFRQGLRHRKRARAVAGDGGRADEPVRTDDDCPGERRRVVKGHERRHAVQVRGLHCPRIHGRALARG